MLQCQNLTIGYENKAILQNINFSVNAGDYLCILGENGAGKSTLMKTILGLISPLSGSITMTHPHELGYLPQQTQRQKDFPATVWEIVLSGCLPACGARPFYSKAQKQLAKDTMARLELEPLKKRCYRELSGGQQERVLLARALCTSGKMLLLDEPTAGLDPHITQELYNLLGDLNQQEGVTFLMISHDLTAAMEYASHILALGKNPFFGTKEEYIQWEHHCKVCDSLPDAEPCIPTDKKENPHD